MSEQFTLGTVGRRLRTKTPEYDWFPVVAYGWGTIHPSMREDVVVKQRPR
jgi:hypothetical protein